MNFITSLFKRTPTAESLWNKMAVSRTTRDGKINFPTSDEEEQILEKVKEFVKADSINFFKFIDGKNGQHTLLTTSLKYQMKSVAEFLLSAGANPNFFSNFQGIQYTTDSEQLMPLRLAIHNHWFDVAKTMMKTADTSLSTRTSLLALAIQEGADSSLIQALVDKGTPEELSTLISQEYTANFISQAKAAKLLFNKFKHKLGTETPLHQAAKKASIGMISVFHKNGHPMNPVNGNEGTPLQIATAQGHEDSIVALINAGANPNTQATNGNTPLHVTKDPQIIQFLIESGANPFIANDEGSLPFLQMVEDAKNYDSSFEAIFTSLNKGLAALLDERQNGSVTHAKQVLRTRTDQFMSDFISQFEDLDIQDISKQKNGPKFISDIEMLKNAAMVLNTCITEQKSLSSPKLQSLITQMSSIVANILINDKFDEIAREVKATSQAEELHDILATLNGVAKTEGMQRVQNRIAILQKTLN